jgi:hypothetical protein
VFGQNITRKHGQLWDKTCLYQPNFLNPLASHAGILGITNFIKFICLCLVAVEGNKKPLIN